jgi:DEAD/DEAH box helicase domain-containing protein
MPFPEKLSPALVVTLHRRGYQSLYSHQLKTFLLVEQGAHVAVVTGTASGKTLCYTLPVFHHLLSAPGTFALFLFPTKALAHDQEMIIRSFLPDEILDLSLGDRKLPKVAVYDGDTPERSRSAIRTHANVILSNPDMLHSGILPHHTSWASFFRGLRFIVIDEMHTYRGVFGSHVANVLRRLRRVAQFYGSNPQFILTSATIANPKELAEQFVEAPVEVIDEDGSARGSKHFLIYNPPLVDRPLGIRRSAIEESIHLLDDLYRFGIQVISFGRTRRMVELMLSYLRERLPGSRAQVDQAVRGYRSGYLSSERREIERGLRLGIVRAVVATNALELGIDIGGMDATVMVGYPGTIAATWQQAGRSGRGMDDSLSVLVASAKPLDQYLARHPEYFFGQSPERALINPDHTLILLGHLQCAAFELPFKAGDSFGALSPEHVREYLEYLEAAKVLYRSGEKYFWLADQYPAQGVSLRSASPETILLQVDDGAGIRTIGQVDVPSATWMIHPGAIYLHEANPFLVQKLDLETKIASLIPAEVDYYTEPSTETKLQLVEKSAEAQVAGAIKARGDLLVTTQVVGFRRIHWHTQQILGLEPLDLPSMDLRTTGYWIALNEQSVNQLQDMGLWRNAPNDYGSGWNTLRNKVRARDNYRCQVCGVIEQGRAHDVHHKIPVRMFYSIEQANQLSNLITLCPSCHRRAEATVRVQSGLAGLSYVLGNLAPLFLMCDPRDLGVHSDPQSPIAGGKPLVALYDLIPAGIGFSQRLYEIHAGLITRALDLVRTCGCMDGCPSCVGPGGEGGSGGKRETEAILAVLTVQD